ncbi:MAG: PadR family transcriptional regulator [Candidatus Bathyarchaeia archaeon]|nr:helix-turn-helix transcriptional regulator [Candidatus Bathyarchaeota archaeon]
MSLNLEKEWRERFVKTNLDLIILRLLKEKPRWGYEINLEIRNRFKVYLSAGTLYPLLHSLENKGYIEGAWKPEGGREKRIYKITLKGEEFLEAGEKALERTLLKREFNGGKVG